MTENKKETLVKLKEQLKAASSRVSKKIRDNAATYAMQALAVAVPSNIADATTPSDNDNENSKTETVFKANSSRLMLKPENIRITPQKVNVLQGNQLIGYEFHNEATDSFGHKIQDFPDATKYSIWDVTYKREVGTEKNPVGVWKSYAGSMQFNRSNAVNVAIYAMLKPQYNKIGKKFFNPNRTGNVEDFNKALKNFKTAYAQNGNLALHFGNKDRLRVAQFIVPDFKRVFEKEGLENPEEFLALQRNYTSDSYVSFDNTNFQKIINTLKKNNIKIQDVSWAVVGMWCAKQIATGNFSGIEATLRGKTLSQINSEEYINTLSAKFPSVFVKGSGKSASDFARQHYKEPPSITTMRELSIMTGDKNIFRDYVKLLAGNGSKGVTYAQAQSRSEIDFSTAYEMLAKTKGRN